jgi:hypothetical protein
MQFDIEIGHRTPDNPKIRGGQIEAPESALYVDLALHSCFQI